MKSDPNSKRAQRDKILRILALSHGYICWYCGLDIKFKHKHIDHIVPRSRGGYDELENFALACQYCNLAKKDRSLEEFIEWLNAIKRNKLPHHDF